MLEFSDRLDESSERRKHVSALVYHLGNLLTNDHRSRGEDDDFKREVRQSIKTIERIPAPDEKLANCLNEINRVLQTVHSPSDLNDERRVKIFNFRKELKPEG